MAVAVPHVHRLAALQEEPDATLVGTAVVDNHACEELEGRAAVVGEVGLAGRVLARGVVALGDARPKLADEIGA